MRIIVCYLGPVENSHLIEPDGSAAAYPLDLYTFVSGERPSDHSVPARIAWALEAVAAQCGWREGENLGTEESLVAQLGVSREALREGIRILERRGSMQMARGRFGGLKIARPDGAHAAAALALYLRLSGYTLAQACEAATALSEAEQRVVARLDGAQGLQAIFSIALAANDLLIHSLSTGAGEAPVGYRPMFPKAHAMGATTAMRIMDHAIAGEDHQARIGSEWELEGILGVSRAAIRQGLRILADFDLIECRRGRKGGAFFKEPGPLGVIRQVHALIAVWGHSPADLIPLVWELNLAHLRLATLRTAAMAPQDRDQLCQSMAQAMDDALEPTRWISLQKSIAQIADNPMVDVLILCLVSYQMRMFDLPATGRETSRLLDLERSIIDALRTCQPSMAEQLQIEAQMLISAMVVDQMSETNLA